MFACKKESHQSFSGNPFADEPPANPYLADSPWAITHRNSYAQASSPYAGPDGISSNTKKDFKDGSPGMITTVISGPYTGGQRVLWSGNVSHVLKTIDTDSGFKFIAMKYGTRLFYGRGLRQDPYQWKNDPKQFEAWRSKKSDGKINYIE